MPTELQLRILRAMVAGQTVVAIAHTCKIGERTVRRHVDDLAEHVGVKTRLAVLVEAAQRRWLDPAPDEATAPAPRRDADRLAPIDPYMHSAGRNRPT